MEKLYKLTDKAGRTYGDTQWNEGTEHTAPGGGALCTEAWMHAYRTPEQAVYMAPSYGYVDGTLWEAEGEVGIDDGTKVGCTRLRTLRRIEMPTLTTEQRVEVAIRCAMTVYSAPGWTAWAEGWLSGKDRSAAAAYAAACADAARAAVYAAAARAAVYAAVAAAAAYADAARAAVYAAAYAVYADAYADAAAAAAASYAAAAYAAAARAATRKQLPLVDIVRRAVRKEGTT